ncbi:MAG TPA: MTAP family purine nucleoside phosphorylase [Candidatus Poseidoniaceae archaeon]|nr:MAG TPA: S-methyl-5'-thioadenosine phosphorylase [Candidatus Poseidoniales archaeon]HII11079.1 MTAP family purine nucleoside phosphorylase [Candidatus Poseidoniaceae archaeon]|tara:strand:- start:13036 stop:13845 length:810 start_codon:yes stop_codon:yes gene_type:complete
MEGKGGASMQRLGVIGGTGLIDMTLGDELKAHGLALTQRDQVVVETPYGEVPLTCIELTHGEVKKELIFLQRHHNDGEASKPPHMIEHRANMKALADAGCEAIMAVCSVGAIPQDFPPGKVALANQYLDFTGHASTFHDDAAVFTSVTDPFDSTLNATLESVLRTTQGFDANERMHYTYWLAQGPHFETKAEIDAIDTLGGHMVGMTMPREVKLARELNLPYAAVCISSNWAAGREPGDASQDLDHHSVSAQANQRLAPVWACMLGLLV